VYAGQFIEPEHAPEHTCIVIAGSHYSAYDDEPWIHQLRALLPQYVQRGAKLIGCCFGAQVWAMVPFLHDQYHICFVHEHSAS
jgi:GMP synthase-like glutamine amidotransferase